jgi:3-dehydroquinate dehydratase (EC 4.2.1.10)
MIITVVNGPNLNLLGKREPGIYGNQSFEAFFIEFKAKYPDHTFHYFQSNHEGGIIDHLHQIGFKSDGIILNAGAFSHYSYAIADALAAIPCPVVEVHISNIHARKEAFRHQSVLTSNCVGIISGFGLKGYELAAAFLLTR